MEAEYSSNNIQSPLTNTDNVFFRNASIAVMHYLHSNIKVVQVIGGSEVEYPVHVFMNKAQDSQFMRDYFTQYKGRCSEVNFVNGDFDMEPYGILTVSNISVNTSAMTNRFVRGNYVVEEKDKNGFPVKKGYSAMLFTLPMDIKFNLEFRTDTSIQSFQVVQALLDCVFKNSVVHFDFRGTRIRSELMLDNDYTPEKKIEFARADDQSEKVKTSIVLTCNYPVFDKSTALFRGDIIRNFRHYINTTVGVVEVADIEKYNARYDIK